MHVWQKLNEYLNPDPLHKAVSQGKLQKVKSLVKAGYDINTYDKNDHTPLRCSLLEKQYHCTVWLLKYKANPNILVQLLHTKGKVIQPYCFLDPNSRTFELDKDHKSSVIKLLVMHGATKDEVKFNKNAKPLEEIFDMTQKIYEKTLQLEEIIVKDLPESAKQACELLNKIWQQFAKDEKNSIFQNYYMKRAQYYENKALNFEQELNLKIRRTEEAVEQINNIYSHPANIYQRHNINSTLSSSNADSKNELTEPFLKKFL